MNTQPSSRRLLGIAVMIVLAASGIIYSRYGYSMLFPTNGAFVNHIGDIAGGDFLVFYNAAVMTLKGAAHSVWDHAAFDAHLFEIYGQNITKLHFFNPPIALLMWTPLGLLEHSHALWLWTLLPLIALGWCIHRLTGHWFATILSVIAPLTAYTAGGGQTGILFAALMAAFMLTYERYPMRAGSAAALFAIKPHLALAMPICFLIDRNWRALIAMATVVGALSAIVTAMFGFQIWMSFLDGVRYHSNEFFSATNPTFDRSPSILLLLLRLGISDTIAWIIQIIFSLATLAMLTMVWRTATDPLHRAFALALAICLLTPKVVHYDAMVLLVPIAMLVPRIDRGTADMSLVMFSLLIWCLPYFEPGFRAMGFHPGGLVLFAGLAMIALKCSPFTRTQHLAA